ncbi:IS66 family insertion sequence element accessory protein TnpB, partial [Escherichia coli]|uniref:IS66 family insertion sequence element accessory protein TnpB n=1 Tax=Escherichia coli TaxID=562 RepID=UPI0020103E57
LPKDAPPSERLEESRILTLIIGALGIAYPFRGRRGDTVKILWADADGLCLFTKRLEEGQFIWPAVRDGKISITRSQLAML